MLYAVLVHVSQTTSLAALATTPENAQILKAGIEKHPLAQKMTGVVKWSVEIKSLEPDTLLAEWNHNVPLLSWEDLEAR